MDITPPTNDESMAECRMAGRHVSIDRATMFALAVDLLPAPGASVRGIGLLTLPACVDAGLTTRELEVLALRCQRLTDPEIAARLFTSPRAAEDHVAHIIAKLGVENRRDAAAAAARMELV